MTTIQTPMDVSLAVQDGALTYWKQILPQTKINYFGAGVDFNQSYMDDLILAFNEKALPQTPFVLADADNKHTMDPERYRGEVVDMRKHEDLPDDVKAKVGGNSGLYAKIQFPNKESAAAVLNNTKLGVSARIRENIGPRVEDGKKWARGIIHVLGTLDPRATSLSPWHAVDLSNDGDTVVLDLSREIYPEKDGDGMGDTTDLSTLTEDDIDAMSEAEIDALLEAVGIDPNDLESLTGDDEDEDEDDNDTDESDDSEDDENDEGAGVQLSNTGSRDMDLAYAANERANEALRRMGLAEWKERRGEFIRQGVPPHMLDLATPILSRPNEMVIDLSNTDDGDVNVSEILLSMIEASKGLVPVGEENGHSGQTDLANSSTEEDALLEQYERQFPIN